MAKSVQMRHPGTGLVKTGYFGFSWTTLLFGFFPALFRSDFVTFVGGFVISIIIGLVTFGIGPFVINVFWAFMYNKYYSQKLFERGYVLSDTDDTNRSAAEALGVSARQ